VKGAIGEAGGEKLEIRIAPKWFSRDGHVWQRPRPTRVNMIVGVRIKCQMARTTDCRMWTQRDKSILWSRLVNQDMCEGADMRRRKVELHPSDVDLETGLLAG
jgi:hypothetical protein